MKYILDWTLPVALFLSLIINYLFYISEFCYNYLILTLKQFNLAFFYLYMYNLVFILLIWSFIQIIIQKQPEIKHEYRLTNRKLKKLLLNSNHAAYTHDISSTDCNDYTRIDPKSNEILENYIRKVNLEIITRNSLGQISVCLACKIIKPDRCYHCKRCSKCILKRDHHCRWLNNCIGYSNQKYFILFLFYLTIIKIISITTTFNYFLYNISQMILNSNFNYVILIFFIFNFILLIPLLLLTANTFYLAAINSTSIEIKYPPRFSKSTYSGSLNQFDLKSIYLNLAQVLGPNLVVAFLPISSAEGDGHSFARQI